MNELVIERVELVDFDEIDVIERACFKHPFPKHVYIDDFLNNPYSKYFKLEKNGEIIGFFGLWVIYEKSQLTTIGVSPRFQGQGYASFMIDYMVNYLKNEGCENITLEVRISNEKAISLYLKHKFKHVALRKHYYENGEDAYLMKLDL